MVLKQKQQWFLVVLLVVAIASCSNNPVSSLKQSSQASSTATNCRSIDHQMGITEVCGRPEKIVVLGSSLLEVLLALGMQPVGFADRIPFHQGNYDNPREQIPYLGSQITGQPANLGLDYNPSIEAILKTQPDLIVGTEANRSQYQTLSKIAPTLLFKRFDSETSLRAIAKATEQTGRAEQLLAQVDRQIAASRAALNSVVATQPKVLMLVSSSAQDFHLISHTNSFCGSLVRNLGFQLVYPPDLSETDLERPSLLSLEALPQLNDADSIVLLAYDWDNFQGMDQFENNQLQMLKRSWKKNAIAQSLAASKVGRVYFMPAYLCLGLPGPIGTELYLNELEEQLLSSQSFVVKE